MDLHIFLSHHDLSIVNYISDRVIVIYMGQIMEILKANNLFSVAKHPYTKALIDAIPDIGGKEFKKPISLRDNLILTDNNLMGCPFRVRCNYSRIECEGVNMKLIKAEYSLDRQKLTFYYTADGRVDFRQLVRIWQEYLKQELK